MSTWHPYIITTKHKFVLFPNTEHKIIIQNGEENTQLPVKPNQVVVIGPRKELEKDAHVYRYIESQDNQASVFLAIPPLQFYKPDSTWLKKNVVQFLSPSSSGNSILQKEDVVLGITKRYTPMQSIQNIVDALHDKQDIPSNTQMTVELIRKMVYSFILDIICGIGVMLFYKYVHNDIKINNIVYDQDTKRFKLMDFGNSLSLEDKETFKRKMLDFSHVNKANEVIFLYMNPLIQGLRDKKPRIRYKWLSRADIWSLALIASKITVDLCQLGSQCDDLPKNITKTLLKKPTGLGQDILDYIKQLKVKSSSKYDKAFRNYTIKNQLLQGRSVDDIYDEIKDILDIGIEDLMGYLTASSNTTSTVVPETSNNDNEQEDPSDVSATTITFATSPPAQLYNVINKDTTTYSPFPYEKFESNTKQTYSAAKNIKIAPFSIVVRPWRIHGLDKTLHVQKVIRNNEMEDGFFECVLKVFDPIPDKDIILHTWKTFKTNNIQRGNNNMPLLLFWTAKYLGICLRYIQKTNKHNNYVASIVVVPITNKTQQESMQTSECGTTFIYYTPTKLTKIGVTITHEKNSYGKGTKHHFAIAQYSNALTKPIRNKLIKDIARENLPCDYNNGDVYQPGNDNLFQDGYIQLTMTPNTNPPTDLWAKLSTIKDDNKKWLANQIVTLFNRRPQYESMHLVLWTSNEVTQDQINGCLKQYRYTILVEAALWYYVVFETIEGITTTTIVNIKRTNLQANISKYKQEIKGLFKGTDMHISTIHDLIPVCETTQDSVPFVICSLFFIEENIKQKRRWWVWPNIIVNIKKTTYFTDLTEIKENKKPDQLAWWVYKQLTIGLQESIVIPSSSSSSLVPRTASDEQPTSSWLSCSPCLDCFAPKPKTRKRKHNAQPQERKRTRPSSPLQIDWKQAYCDLLGVGHNHGSAHLVKYTFTRQHTTGNGDCFFHAILGSARSFPESIEHVLRSGYNQHIGPLRVQLSRYTGNRPDRNISNMGVWINTDDMQYIAEQLGICIFLYGLLGNDSHGWRIFNGQNVRANNVVYIYNNGQATSGNTSGTHFETLLRHDQQNFDCND